MSMGLSEGQRAAVKAILTAPLAISSMAGLHWCRAEIEELEALGYVERWTPRGTADTQVTLTGWGADALGVDLDERGEDEHPVWEYAPPPDPRLWPRKPVRLPKIRRERPLPRPEIVPAPFGDPVFAWATPRPPKEIMSRLKKKIASQKTRGKKRRK